MRGKAEMEGPYHTNASQMISFRNPFPLHQSWKPSSCCRWFVVRLWSMLIYTSRSSWSFWAPASSEIVVYKHESIYKTARLCMIIYNTIKCSICTTQLSYRIWMILPIVREAIPRPLGRYSSGRSVAQRCCRIRDRTDRICWYNTWRIRDGASTYWRKRKLASGRNGCLHRGNTWRIRHGSTPRMWVRTLGSSRVRCEWVLFTIWRGLWCGG
jgi:hypothetical protein